jgi:hypothetical protein
VLTDRTQDFRDTAAMHPGANRPGANVPQSLLDACWRPTLLTGFPASHRGIAAFAVSSSTRGKLVEESSDLTKEGDVWCLTT